MVYGTVYSLGNIVSTIVIICRRYALEHAESVSMLTRSDLDGIYHIKQAVIDPQWAPVQLTCSLSVFLSHVDQPSGVCSASTSWGNRYFPAQDNENGNDVADSVKEHACETLALCILTTLNKGLRNGGGIGDVLRPPSLRVSRILRLVYYTNDVSVIKDVQ